MDEELERLGIWGRIRRFLEPESMGETAALMGTSMLPGVGTALDAADIAAGVQDRDPTRVGIGVLAAALPFVSSYSIRSAVEAAGGIANLLKKEPNVARLGRAIDQGFDVDNPVVHWTRRPGFDRFLPFSHFGTNRAAFDRLRNIVGKGVKPDVLEDADVAANEGRRLLSAQRFMETDVGGSYPVFMRGPVLDIGEDSGVHTPFSIAFQASRAAGLEDVLNNPSYMVPTRTRLLSDARESIADGLKDGANHFDIESAATGLAEGMDYGLRRIDAGKKIDILERIDDLVREIQAVPYKMDRKGSEYRGMVSKYADTFADILTDFNIASSDLKSTSNAMYHSFRGLGPHKNDVAKSISEHLTNRTGYPVLSYKNIAEDKGSTSYIASIPSAVRSVFANFDPDKIDSDDLMAGIAGLMGAGTAGYFARDQLRRDREQR